MTLNPAHFITNGEPVTAGVANRVPMQHERDIEDIYSMLGQSLHGQGVIARDMPVEAAAVVGMAVSYSSVTQQWQRALAAAETDTLTGQLKLAPIAKVWGVILTKPTATSAHILISGIADIDLSSAVSGGGVAGKCYFLSGVEPGKLTTDTSSIAIAVLQTAGINADGTHRVSVNVSAPDVMNAHRHYRFTLQARPSGTHIVPDYGGVHVINPVDASIEGWLPAGHSIFGGKAPIGAKFGYNLPVSDLQHLWPPQPVGNAVLEMVKGRYVQPMQKAHFTWAGNEFVAAGATHTEIVAYSPARIGDHILISTGNITDSTFVLQECQVLVNGQVSLTFLNTADSTSNLTAFSLYAVLSTTNGENLVLGAVPTPQEVVQITKDGIWWMTDCCGEVPWLTTYGTPPPGGGPACPTELDVHLTMWFSKPIFRNTATAVLSLSPKVGSGVSLVCADTGQNATTGHLQLDVDLDIATGGVTTEAGYVVAKTMSGHLLNRGPVVESVRAGSPNVTVSSDLEIAGKHYGNLVVGVETDLDGKEIAVDTVRLSGVTEEYYKDVLGLGFDPGINAEFRGRLQVPDTEVLPAGNQLKLRFRILNRLSAALPSGVFHLSYRRIPKPPAALTPAALPVSDTALAAIPVGPVSCSSADMYMELETVAFNISAGDTILFTLSRTGASDGYAGSLLLLRQCGVIVITP